MYLHAVSSVDGDESDWTMRTPRETCAVGVNRRCKLVEPRPWGGNLGGCCYRAERTNEVGFCLTFGERRRGRLAGPKRRKPSIDKYCNHRRRGYARTARRSALVAMPCACRRRRGSRLAATAVLLWTKIRCALAEPAKCRKLVRDNSTSAAASGLGFGERYVNIVHCGNFSLLISRLQPNLREFEWITIARPWINGRA